MTERLNPLKKNKYRNLPCPCGSQVKFKKCCWKDEPQYVSKLDHISKVEEAFPYKMARRTMRNFKRLGMLGAVKRKTKKKDLTKENKSFITKLVNLVRGKKDD